MIESKAKLILLITTFAQRTDWNLIMGASSFKRCPVSNCLMTNDKSLSTSEFDAVLFHLGNIEDLEPEELPDKLNRTANQRYVMFFHEHPSVQWTERLILKLGINHFFNWTMTYRLDSDIPIPYGWIVPKLGPAYHVPSIHEIGNWNPRYDSTLFVDSLEAKPSKFFALARRPRGAAWAVSHCNTDSERELYVNELSKHMQIDIFGKCGSSLCDSLKNVSCSDYIVQNYMFYLAFENAFCDDYVTEKLWSWMSREIVPVVFGQANYSSITPPHSVINALDYSEPKYLAAYLKHLMANEVDYLSYFWWKDHYAINANSRISGNIELWPDVGAMSSKLGLQPSFCKLCEMLNDAEQPSKVVDLTTYLLKEGHCRQKGTQSWSKYKSIAEERLIYDSLLFASLLLIIFATKLLISKLEWRHSKVILKVKSFISCEVIRLCNFYLALFCLLVLFLILSRASLGNFLANIMP